MANVYVDFTKSTGVLTGTWTFTNASASVTAAGDGDAVNELANGDYVRQSDGTQWYKVTDRPDADTITVTPVFQQATHTDDVGASLYNSEDGSAIAQAFANPNAATDDNARSAGDVVKLRANQTHVLSGIVLKCDSHGAVNNFITLKGCDSVDDPWSDASDVRPVIDFDNNSTHGIYVCINTITGRFRTLR